MAVVFGTTGNDFIHVAGDGLTAPHGYTDNPGATNFEDIIYSGNAGSEIIYAGGGNDAIHFGSDLGSTDLINGGAGNDTLVLDGHNSVVFGANSMIDVEKILLPFIPLPPGTAGFHELTMHDGNLAAGLVMTIDAREVGADTFFYFNGSAETDGFFHIIGGAGDDTIIGSEDANIYGGLGGDAIVLTEGGRDTVIAGAGFDTIFVNDTLTAEDHITVGANDLIFLGGPSYAAGLTFAADTLTVDGSTFDDPTFISLDPIYDYKFTLNDANVSAGSWLFVSLDGPFTSHTLNFEASAETDGSFILNGDMGNDRLICGGGNDLITGDDGKDVLRGGNGDDRITGGDSFDGSDDKDRMFGGSGEDELRGGDGSDFVDGGRGQDKLDGGGGRDTFFFGAASESTSVDYDTVTDGGALKKDLWDVSVVTSVDPAINAGALDTSQFDADLAAAVDAAHLGAFRAVLFTPDSGGLAGETFLIVDFNGTAGYQAGEDLVVLIANPKNPEDLQAGDFI